MPIVESLMTSLVHRHGEKKGREIYYAMEASGKGPFAEGAKHHDLHKQYAERHGLAPNKGSKRAGGNRKPGVRSPRKPTQRRR